MIESPLGAPASAARGGSVIAVTALALLSLVACTEPPPPAEPGRSAAAIEQQELDRLWSAFSARFPNTERPEVDVVRHISPSEWTDVIASCVIDDEKVSSAAVDDEGSIGWTGPTVQEESFHLAMYVCQARYPKEAKYLTPFSPTQIAYLYDFYVTEQAPCLEDHGYSIPAAPSLARFTETFESSPWYPYQAVPLDLAHDRWLELVDACPQEPDEAIYDLD